MLNDALGTIVAFLTIILLLSILVTGLVQASQALLGVRGRVLFRGIAKFIANKELRQPENGPRRDRSAVKQAKRTGKDKSREILNDPDIALTYHVAAPLESRRARAWRFLRGPGISWVDPDDLASRLSPW